MKKKIVDQTLLLLPMSLHLKASSNLQIEVSNQYKNLQFTENSVGCFFDTFIPLHRHSLHGSLSLAFLEGGHHSRLHGQFLQDYRPTDVITFPPDPEEDLAGEICVSVDQAINESKKHGLTFEKELSLYLIHGWLHLVGFNDLEDMDRKIMRQEEKKAMSLVEKHDTFPDFRLALGD